MSSKVTLCDIRKLVRAYYRGVFTLLELLNRLAEHIDRANVHEVLGCCPVEIRTELRKWVDHRPRTDAEWNQLVYISGGTFVFTGSEQEYQRWWQERQDRRRRLERKGVEALRSYFSDPKVQWLPAEPS
jgi:hypothetical protein